MRLLTAGGEGGGGPAGPWAHARAILQVPQVDLNWAAHEVQRRYLPDRIHRREVSDVDR